MSPCVLQLCNCVEIGLPMLILLVISQQVRNNHTAPVYGCIIFPKGLFGLYMCYMQHLQHLHSVAKPMLERYALLVCIALVWAFAAILTVSGAYNNVKQQTKLSCRTDRSFLMSSAPWYIMHFRIRAPCNLDTSYLLLVLFL